MVKVMITKLVKLKVVLVDLQWLVFKPFFHNGEGNIEVINHIESHSGVSSNMYFQLFFDQVQGNDYETSQNESHFNASSGASSKVYFQKDFQPWRS